MPTTIMPSGIRHPPTCSPATLPESLCRARDTSGRRRPLRSWTCGHGSDRVLLKGKRALIMGVANQRSIAWGIASAFHREGAELAFTYQNDRLKENLDELLETIGGPSAFPTFPCDVQNDEHLRGVFEG